MHLFTPNHVQLLNSCYPPASALLTAGPDYSPNSQELSRLTYYASNHPGKLTKLGTELEKRLKNETRKARTGNIRTRASLLITLSIFRALATECRRDIALLSPSLVASVDATLTAAPTDLEIAARAASVFTAWTTYTDGHLIGTDKSLTDNYQSVLRRFAQLSYSSAIDPEVQNRTRLIGFAALTGALNSEALYNDSTQFKLQVSTIMRPILMTLFETDVDTLNEQAAAAKAAPSSPYLAEFRTRPAMERRAASIHVHIDGDKGPSMADVSSASLRALLSLVGHANSPQIGFIMHSSVDNIEEAQAWGNLHHCCWLAQKMVEWSQYQYRYAVPTWLVERLCRSQETSSLAHYRVLAEMTTTVFRSPTPLVNLSTSDIASNLTTLLLRRTESDSEDPLVPALIECIASLGRHVYYSDQIQDLANELINRIVTVEVQGVLSRGKTGSAQSRTQAVRSLLAALLGLIRVAEKELPGPSSSSGHGPPSAPAETFKQEFTANDRVSRRTTVSPDIWQDTLSLLCDDDYMVRADYSDALIYYLSEEMPKHGDATADGKRLSEGPLAQTVKINLLLHAGNHGTKLLHAIHAYLYILATSSTLGLTPSSSTSPSQSTHEGSPDVNMNESPSASNGDDDNEGPESTISPSLSAPKSPRAKKLTAVQRLLDQTPPGLSTSASARLADYTLILDILTTIHEELPVRGLLTGIPMLLALDEVISNAQDPKDPATTKRVHAIREVIANVWLVLGGVWNTPELVQLAESALTSGPSSLPTIERTNLVAHLPPRHAVDFSPDQAAHATWSGVNVKTALTLLTASPGVHEATGLDRETLMRRLSTKWTAATALRDSVERSSSFENTFRGDGVAPLLKISPALMHVENISQASLARSTWGVGVADLRGALEGRSSTSNPALGRPASISTHTPSTFEGGHLKLTQTRSRPQSRSKKRSTPGGTGEVRDVLNRLGIGKQNGSLLKASFPLLQNSDQRAPPYKS